MAKVLVLYYSSYGHVETMAKAVAEGAAATLKAPVAELGERLAQVLEQMKALDAMGIDYEVIPGVSSFLAAAASLKQELTLPGVSQTVIVTRVEGQTPVPAKESLKVLAQSKATLCIFLSANQIEKIVGELLPSYGPDCPAAVVYKSTWKEEKIVRTPLSKLAEGVKREGIKKTALIIVGEVLARDFERSQVYQSR